MRLVRMGLLVAAAATTLAAGCTFEGPGPETPVDLPPAPTAPVGADGQPLVSLCDLLTSQDISEVAGVEATAPPAVGPAEKAATCDYAKNTKFTIEVGSSMDDAMAKYQAAVRKAPFTTVVKDGAMGGIDESVYGVAGDQAGLAMRRQMLVLTIVLPKDDQAEQKLIQLGGRALSRVNALGTNP
jgi:hypothetical protein